MSKTAFVAYGDVGFWAYDVGLGIFLKFLIDRTTHRTTQLESREGHEGLADPEQAAWLHSCIDEWRRAAVDGGNFGLTFDYPMSEEHLQITLQLADEACRELGARESIPGREMESWNVLPGHGVYSRGYAEFPTAPVIELGRAIQDLLQGTLLPAPRGKLWFFGTPTGRQVIAMRYEDPERPEGISIKVNSALEVEQTFLVAGEVDSKTGRVNHILKFTTNAPLQSEAIGRYPLSPTQVEAIFALVRETKLGLFPPDDDCVKPMGDLTTVAVKRGRFRLELEFRSDAPKEWKQVEKLVKTVRDIVSQASGVEMGN